MGDCVQSIELSQREPDAVSAPELRLPHFGEAGGFENRTPIAEQGGEELTQIAGSRVQAARWSHAQFKSRRREDAAVVGPKKCFCQARGEVRPRPKIAVGHG